MKKPKFQNNATQGTLREKKKLLLWMNSLSEIRWALLNEYLKKRFSTRKETITNLGRIRNKMCISQSTCFGSAITRGKEKRKDSTTSHVSEHSIKVYSHLSWWIYADVNKRQITGGKNSPDKLQEKRGNIPRMINLRFGVQALPLNPNVWRKADRIYRWQTVFLPFAIWRKTFSLLAFTWFFFFVSFFYSTKEYCY